jgi:thiol-disulfide isomerase/thioredoxin
MDKWKIVLIVVLLGGLAGYGFYQQATVGETPVNMPAKPEPPEDPTKGPLVGKPAAAWNIPAGSWMNTPQPISLQDVKGHITILEFFRIECPHCEDAVPFMRSLYTKYKPQGLRMVTFQSPGDAPVENDWSKVQATLRRWKVTYPVAFDKNADLFVEKYKGDTYPTTLVIDEKGIIRYQETGYGEDTAKALESFIVKSLKK